MRDFDLTGFWEDSDYARKEYVGASVTNEMIQSVQAELGCRLPKAYAELLRSQNGGIPVRTRHRTSQPTSWAADHVAITGIYALIVQSALLSAESSAASFGWGNGDIRISESILLTVHLRVTT